LGSVLRRQAPLLLLVVYPEDAGVAGGERREQILEVAHLGSGADRDGVAVPRIQDGCADSVLIEPLDRAALAWSGAVRGTSVW